MKLNRLFISLFVAAPLFAMGQKNYNLSYRIGTEVTFSNGEHSPYWLTANRFGLGGAEKIISTFAPVPTGTNPIVTDGILL